MKIYDLIDKCGTDFAMPIFQRDFVWKDKARFQSLIDSLYKDYPIGMILLWKFQRPSDIENDKEWLSFISKLTKGDQSIKQNYIEFVVDGQQRLTALCIMTGERPNWWRKDNWKFDGVLGEYDLHVNILSEDDKEPEIGYLDAIARQTGDKRRVSIREIFITKTKLIQKAITPLDWENFVKEKMTAASITEEKSMAKARAIIDEMSKIIDQRDVYVEKLKIQNPLEISEIFDRVNTEGVRVTDADVAFALIAANDFRSNWPDKFDRFKDWLKKNDFVLKTPTLLKIIALAMEDKAGVEKLTTRMDRVIGKIKHQNVSSSWSEIRKAVEGSVLFLKSIGVPKSYYIIHDNVFVIMSYFWRRFLLDKPISESLKKRLTHWFLKSIYSSLYASSESRTSEVINDLKGLNDLDEAFEILNRPLDSLKFALDEGYFSKKHGARSLSWLLLYLLIQNKRACDWFSGEKLFYDSQMTRTRQLELHHIFPKDCLKQAFQRKEVNLDEEALEIYKQSPANFAIISGGINVKIGADEPIKYFKTKIPDENREEIVKQLIPVEKQELLQVKNFELFIKERDSLLRQWFSNYINTLV